MRLPFGEKICRLVYAVGLVFCVFFGQTVANEVEQTIDNNSDAAILQILESALANQRELLATITRENLIKMSGFQLDEDRNASFRTKLNFSSSKGATDEKVIGLINKTLGTKRLVNSSQETGEFSNKTLDYILLGDVDPQVKCLAEAIYFEARGEDVIVNRVDEEQFPSSVCKVVSEGATKLNSCQFSYNCDGKPEYINDLKSYKRILKLSDMFYDGTARLLTGGATFYHSRDVNPSWTTRLKKTREIGRHIFYKIESRVAQN